LKEDKSNTKLQYPAERASAEKFPGKEGEWKNQDREITPISLSLFYQWRARERNGHMLRAHVKKTLHQEPRVKSKDLFRRKIHFRENAHYNFLENLKLFMFEKKNCNQRSNELRWLVRVGMFSQNECLLQNTLEISRMKI